jgi:hypothetical protein
MSGLTDLTMDFDAPVAQSRLAAVGQCFPAQRGERPNIGVGIGIEFINACSIFPHAKSIAIPIAAPMVQIVASADIHP